MGAGLAMVAMELAVSHAVKAQKQEKEAAVIPCRLMEVLIVPDHPRSL